MKTPKSVRAFTLVELLVVIGIIAILISLLAPVLAKARVAAQELRSEGNLRQMMLGYVMYYQDNHGSVLLGYTPPTVDGAPVTVSDPVSDQTFGTPIADRYPWRLAPYVDNIWQILHSHEAVPPVPHSGESTSQAFSDAYALSLNPTYGLNSVFLGGDANFGGFTGPGGDRPNVGAYIVFKANQVRDASQLIVFTDCRCYNVPGLVYQGLYTVTPPRAGGVQWTFAGGQFQFTHGYSVIGVPQGWYSQRVAVAYFDCHVDMRLPTDLLDMQLWANWADSSDYDYAP